MKLFVVWMSSLLAGGAVGGVAMFGLVQSQTQVPDANPATSNQVLNYGDRG